MWRWFRWLLLGFVVLAIGVTSWRAWDKRKENARFAEYNKQVEQLRVTYPVGTRRDVVERKFKSTLGSGDPDLYALLGSDTSAEWYCSGWNTYAHFKFANSADRASERLVSIERFTRGKDCL